jgi:DNA mismatch repair protein MutS2
LSREDRNFDEVVKRLETERAALELARRAAEDAREDADSLKRQLSESLATIEERTKAKLAREANEIYEALRKSREELRQVRATLRAKKPDESQVRAAEKALDRVAAEVRFDAPLGRLLGGPAPAIKPLAEGTLKKGQRVYVSRIRMTAEIVEILAPDQIRVAAGPMKLIVSPSELGEPEAPAEAKRAGKRPTSDLLPPRRDTAPEVAVQTTDNSCDLRGLRTDDALAMAVSFLDRALGSGQKVVFFIHGHGTGAVRDALRKELAMSRYVASHRAGGPHEGGDGVTAAWLAD